MAKGTRYTPEFKAKAVRLLTESRGSYSSETKAIEQVAKDRGRAGGAAALAQPDGRHGRGVEHRVEDLRHLLGDQPVEPGPGQVLVDLYDVRGSWFRLLTSNRGFSFWRMKIVHRTRAMPSYVRAGIRKCARIRALSKIPNDYSTYFVAIP